VLAWWTAQEACLAGSVPNGTQTGFNQQWFGDYDQMLERRVIRVLIPYSKTFYFLDGVTPKGATYEAVKRFEKMVNQELKTRHLKIHIVIIPTSRDRLVEDLLKGLGDIAAGNLTITDERLKKVDFSEPLLTNVDEILVTGPGTRRTLRREDLGGRSIYVRKSSSYHESIQSLNRKWSAISKPAIVMDEAEEYLEDEDILEMVNAGLVPMTVVDNTVAVIWSKIFDSLTLHPDIRFRENGEIAWMIRKNSPRLKSVINRFVLKNKKGTLFGNIIFNRYFKHTGYIRNNMTGKDIERYRAAISFFKQYASQYDFDWVILAALAYQESRIDQSKISPAGAIGVMQMLPSTAKDKNVNIPDIYQIDPNIHAGTKYLRFIVNHYFEDEKVDKLNRVLLALASYNAGPAKISKLRTEALRMGLDPNVWFKNVEVVAAKKIGRETVQYVSNIFKYYLAYRYAADHQKQQRTPSEQAQ